MVFECDKCNLKFSSEDSLKQHNSSKHSFSEKRKSPGLRRYIVLSLIGLIILFSIATVYSYSKRPGKFDDFARCLTKKGVIVYGNDFCSYTNKQLNFFGKSKKYLNYVKCFDNKELCNEKGISVTPTWEIDGKMYPQVQTFDKLSDLTGCKI